MAAQCVAHTRVLALSLCQVAIDLLGCCCASSFRYFASHSGVDSSLLTRSRSMLEEGYKKLVGFESEGGGSVALSCLRVCTGHVSLAYPQCCGGMMWLSFGCTALSGLEAPLATKL